MNNNTATISIERYDLLKKCEDALKEGKLFTIDYGHYVKYEFYSKEDILEKYRETRETKHRKNQDKIDKLHKEEVEKLTNTIISLKGINKELVKRLDSIPWYKKIF